MLLAPAVELYDDEWIPPPHSPKLYKNSSVRSWGVTSIGRGFDWDNGGETMEASIASPFLKSLDRLEVGNTAGELDHKLDHALLDSPIAASPITKLHFPPFMADFNQTYSMSPEHSSFPSRSASPNGPIGPYRSNPTSSPSSPRPRRRSSQQRVSLVAGRVLIAPIEPPSPPPMLPQSLRRTPSSGSVLSNAASTRAPSPTSSENQSFLGGRSISEFLIEGEIGRGAYGLVKRAREINSDGSVGPPLIIKQVIKSRILADCWKKHHLHGTIPIEIYVMSAISNTSYILPARRPWDPSRNIKQNDSLHMDADDLEDEWVEGKVVKGHPNICPLLDFFEDNHYYYLVLPSSTPESDPNKPPPPSDLFDLVETYPHGLPPSLIRTYLGQIADALCFLHSQGIVHRDIKDENVVLGPSGKCILIDFGSSGLVKKSGWDTFSGTLDYAGPEILRGERYYGKEQDVWAFGVVAYVLLIGECPFMTAAEAQEGFDSPFANASISLDERCAEGKEMEGEEKDGGSALGAAAALVRACLQVDPAARPTFEKILQSRFLAGNGGWGI